MKFISFLPSDEPFQKRTGSIVRAAGYHFEGCRNEEEATQFTAQFQEQGDSYYLIVDSREFGFIAHHTENTACAKVVVVLMDPLQEVSTKYLEMDNIFCFVGAFEREFDIRVLIALLINIEKNEFIALKNLLNFPYITNEKKIRTPLDKKNIMTQLEGFIYKATGRDERAQWYAELVGQLAEELISNGIFNANPVMKAKKDARTYQLSEEEAVQISWGYDGDLFALSVRDPFGLLTRRHLLKYVSSLQTRDPLSKDKRTGPGIKMIFDRMHHSIISVQPNGYSDVICLMYFDKKSGDFERRLRSFHFIPHPPKNEGKK